MYYSSLSDCYLPKDADSLFENPNSAELVVIFKKAIINQYHVLGSQYDLLETQIKWMLDNYILKRPLSELLTPRRVQQIDLALSQIRNQQIGYEEGWVDIWHAIHFFPTFMWDKMKSQLGGVIPNL